MKRIRTLTWYDIRMVIGYATALGFLICATIWLITASHWILASLSCALTVVLFVVVYGVYTLTYFYPLPDEDEQEADMIDDEKGTPNEQ